MHKRVLIVDDEKDMVLLLKKRLEATQYEVLTAWDGEEGLEKAVAEQPNLILLDVMMPKKNGYEVCRELKASVKTQAIPIIIITAKIEEEGKILEKAPGASAYLTKPFEMKHLMEKIRLLV